MTKRLQVLFADDELLEIQRAAERAHVTVAEWVRQVLREARGKQPAGDPSRKLAAIRRLSDFEYPTGDVDQMIAEIAAGYGAGAE